MNVNDLSCGLSAVFMSRMETSYTHVFGSLCACTWSMVEPSSLQLGLNSNGRWDFRAEGTWHLVLMSFTAVHRCGRRHSADTPFLALFLGPILRLQHGSREAQCLAATAPYCPNTESEHALIFQFFSDCTHPSFYITGDAISNKIEDERYRTH